MSVATQRLGIWWWVVRGWFVGERELLVLDALVDRGGVFVDVGANAGTYSLTASLLAREVVAYEPNPELAADLRVVLAGKGRVRELAASDREGEASFVVPSEGGGPVRHTRGSLEGSGSGGDYELRVWTGRLDAEGLTDVQLIKIDVEGHESAALRGATELIDAQRPAVIMEAEERHAPGTIAAMAEFFGKFGYTGWYLVDGCVHPFTSFSVDRHQSEDLDRGDDHRATSAYINNFIWISGDRPDLVKRLQAAAPRRRWRSVTRLAFARFR